MEHNIFCKIKNDIITFCFTAELGGNYGMVHTGVWGQVSDLDSSTRVSRPMLQPAGQRHSEGHL